MITEVAWRCAYDGRLDYEWNIRAGVSAQDAWLRLPITGFLWLNLYEGEYEAGVVTPHTNAAGVQYRRWCKGHTWYGLTLQDAYVEGEDPDDMRATYPGVVLKRGVTVSLEAWNLVRAKLEPNNREIPSETSVVLRQ